MKSFLIKLLLFSIGLTAILILLAKLFLNDNDKRFKLKNNVTSVFIGDSMLAYGVNDKLMDNSYNFSRSAESPDWIYAKLKKLKEQNPQIDTVYIAFDDIGLLRSLHQTYGDLINLNNLSTNEALDNVATYLFANGYPHSILSSFKFESLKAAILNLRSTESIFEPGDYGYIPSGRNKLNEDIENDFSRDLILKYRNAKHINFKYYYKIIDYCKENNIKLYFIIAPIHKTIWEVLQYDTIHKAYFSNVPLIDCSHWIYPDSCFGDAIHLNKYGADIFTRDLMNYMVEYNRTDSLHKVSN